MRQRLFYPCSVGYLLLESVEGNRVFKRAGVAWGLIDSDPSDSALKPWKTRAIYLMVQPRKQIGSILKRTKGRNAVKII